MRASEWQYLCAVHDQPKNCSAIDYCWHTLDWAATTLTSSKMFPSRLGLGSGAGGAGGDKMLQQQIREITNIFRRVYRIYAHAWFQHREMFWRVEGKTGLYVFFKTVCDEYGMILAENYTIPAEAEGLEPQATEHEDKQAPKLLKRDDGVENEEKLASQQQEPMGNTILAAGDTTKRHRHTLSDRASSVSTVIQEEAEEEEEDAAKTTLERQTTSVRDMAAENTSALPVDESGEENVLSEDNTKDEKEEEQEDPVVGIASSETIKPTKGEGEVKGEEEVEKEEEEETDMTVVEPSTSERNVEATDAGEAQTDVTEPSEAPAAEGDEATKTVAD